MLSGKMPLSFIKMLTIFQYVRLQFVTNSNALEMRALSIEKSLSFIKMLTVFFGKAFVTLRFLSLGYALKMKGLTSKKSLSFLKMLTILQKQRPFPSGLKARKQANKGQNNVFLY